MAFGIVTSYDSTEYFRRRAEDMMLVEDIEGMVKDLVQAAFIDETGEVDQERLAAAIEEVTSSQRALLGRYRNALRLYLELQGQQQREVDPQCLETSFSQLAQKEKAKEFTESAAESARTFGSRFKDEDVKAKFRDVGKAAEDFGKSIKDSFKK